MERLVKTRQDYEDALAIITVLMKHRAELDEGLWGLLDELVSEAIAYEEEEAGRGVSGEDTAALRRERRATISRVLEGMVRRAIQARRDSDEW